MVNEYFFNSKTLTKRLILDKDVSITNYIRYMLDRTLKIFEYKNLPDTIPDRMLELYLQTKGNVFFTKYKDNYYVFFGGLGGVPDEYYRPTTFIVSNPYLELTKEYNIDKDGVLIYNDSLLQGLLPIHEKYAILLSENDITMRIASINMRLISILTAGDDKTKESALEFLRQIEKGQLGVLLDNRNLLTDKENFTVSPTVTTAVSNYMTQLAEYNQYLKASWYNEIGLQANYNMKRETLNSAETEMDSDVLIPLIDDMLTQRKLGLEKINNMYNLNIEVKLSSAWEDRQNMRDLQEMASFSAVENNPSSQDNIVKPDIDVPKDSDKIKEVENDENT